MTSAPEQMQNEGPLNALHRAARAGSTERTVALLIKGSIDVDQQGPQGSTALHLAILGEHLAVSKMLIEAGANPDSRRVDGATPLYMAAQQGYEEAVKLLLRAKANPLLAETITGQAATPLGIAAQKGHLEVVRGMIQEVGIDGCGGESGGVDALCRATLCQQIDTMLVLTDAGVVDNGKALLSAAEFGHEIAVKFLLQHVRDTSLAVNDYANACNQLGETPLYCAITGFDGIGNASPRIVRLLLDAGADAVSAIASNTHPWVVTKGTPMAYTTRMLREKKVGDKDATQDQLYRLEAVRRLLLLRVEAVHADSWLWPGGILPVDRPAKPTANREKIPTPVTLMLPLLRRRATRPRVLLAALFRNSEKP